jgi:drug/metabolite transporter (DMT)-like permease
MIFIFLTILCSSSIALLLKYNDTKGGDPLVLLAGNYLVASMISLVLFLADKNASISIHATFISLFFGLLFVGSFFSFAKAVSSSGTALATVSSRLSVIVPILLSILIYSEIPGLIRYIGFGFTLVTIFLFYLSIKNGKDSKEGKHLLYLILVLLGVGMTDFSMKIFEMDYSESDKSFFLFSLFFSAFLYSFIFIKIRKISFDRKTFTTGAVVGVPNMFSSFFLISALTQLPAIMVYPVTNIGIIILTTILANIIWHERLNKYGLLSLLAGIAAIIFLGLQ